MPVATVEMCRVPLIDPSAATDPVVRAVNAEIERELGFGIVPNVFRAMAGSPAILRATWDLFRTVVLQGELPRTVKEMIGVVVSAANRSEYALNVHMHSLGVQGIAARTLSVLASGAEESPGLAGSTAALIRLAHIAAHQGPLAVTDLEISRAREQGLTDTELAEAFATINLFHYINSYTDLMRIPVDAI